MTLLLSLVLPSAFAAVPYDLCARAPSGDLSQLGGVYAGDQGAGPAPYSYEELCQRGGPLAPDVSIEVPAEKTYYNEWKRVTVEASVVDPERGDGHCQWFFRTGGVESLVYISTPTVPRLAPDQMWSAMGECAGSLNLAGFTPGEGTLVVVATDLSGASARAETTIILNRFPMLTLTSPSPSVVSPGDVVEYTIVVDDDDLVEGRSVDVFVEDEAGAAVDSASCTLDATHECEVALISPLGSGAYTVVAEYTDQHGADGRTEAPLTTDTAPTLALTSDLAGPYLEHGAVLTLELTIFDPDRAAAPDSGDVSASLSGASTGAVPCDGLSGSAGTYSCLLFVEPSTDGYSTVTVEFDDGSGRAPYSLPYDFLMQFSTQLAAATDTPFVDPGAMYTVSYMLDDEDAAGGTLTSTMYDLNSGASYVSAVDDVGPYGQGYVSWPMAGLGPKEVYFTFVDPYGYTFTSEPVEVYGNTSPTLVLTSSLGATTPIPATKLDEDTTDGVDTRVASWAFDVDDVDEDAFYVPTDVLTVVPDVGLPQPATCAHDADGRGAWECEVDVRDWSIGTYPFTVTVSDGWESADLDLTIEVVGDTDYDYDGDGVTEADVYDAEGVSLGVGWGDCEPDNPEVYGESLDADGVYHRAAPEVCDDWDNDCDGEINEDSPDADDNERTPDSPTLASGELGYGSLHNPDDVDWWGFVAAEDGVETRNAAFEVVITVPDDGTSDPTAGWSVGAYAWAGLYPDIDFAPGEEVERAPVRGTASCDGSGWCAISWSVSSVGEVVNELQWWIGVYADSGWSNAMCSDDESLPTYSIEIVE